MSRELLLQSFTESNAAFVASQLSSASFSAYRSFHYSSTSSVSDSSASFSSTTVSDQMLWAVQFLEHFAVTCAIVLGETISPKKGSGSESIGTMRRASTTASIGGTGGGYRGSVSNNWATNKNIQLDIDRLFARKVAIFDQSGFLVNMRRANSEDINGECLQTVVNVVLKAGLKSVLESVRYWILSYETYIQLQADITLVKQVSSYILRDCSQCESLADQTLRTAFSRFVGANDIASASDNREMSAIARAVTDGLNKIAPHCFVLPLK